MNPNGRIAGEGGYVAFTALIRPFYDNLKVTFPVLFYRVPKTNGVIPPTPFVDRFWDDRERWVSPGVGMVYDSFRPYFGEIPDTPPGPVVGTPDQWENGLSYYKWIAGEYSDPVGCWPVNPIPPPAKVLLGLVLASAGAPVVEYGGRVELGLVPESPSKAVTAYEGSLALGLYPDQGKGP